MIEAPGDDEAVRRWLRLVAISTVIGLVMIAGGLAAFIIILSRP